MISEEYNIALSGGADSSLLVYMIADCLEPGNTIRTKTIDLKTRPGVRICVENIIDFMKKKFPHVNFISEFASIPNEESWLEISPEEFRQKKREFGSVFLSGCMNGLTKQIPAEYYKGRTYSDNEYVENDPYMIKRNYTKINQPFGELDGRGIALLYKKYNLVNTLYPMTISCANPVNLVERCNVCNGCKEKYAAFYDLYK